MITRTQTFSILAVAVFIGCSMQPSASNFEPTDAAIVLGNTNQRFRSWNGEWQGTDIDTELEFRPDGTVTITHYGNGVDSTVGTYETEGESVRISVP